MPSFLIRGLARYIAASAMERSASHSSNNYTSTLRNNDNELSESDLSSWHNDMRWLIPFVQATDYNIVIENPKSHEQIIIDKNTQELPVLTLDWMRKYNKQELLEWMEKEKERKLHAKKQNEKNKQARSIAEARGRAKFGDSYTPTEQDVQDIRKNL